MKKNLQIYLTHITESIELIFSYMENKTADDLKSSQGLQDQVVRRLEVIGETARQLPGSFKKEHPEVPWQDMVDFRNVLIHEYFGIDTFIIWDIVERDLPQLKEAIRQIVSQEEN